MAASFSPTPFGGKIESLGVNVRELHHRQVLDEKTGFPPGWKVARTLGEQPSGAVVFNGTRGSLPFAFISSAPEICV
jgi:hypothetical protein